MRKMMTAMAAMTLAMGLAACAEESAEPTATATESGSLAGTWKADVASAEAENDVDSYVFADGTYTCNSCKPPFSVTANGEWQEIDRPGVDALKVTMVDDMTISSASRRDDKQLGESTWTVSEDGQTMTIAWTNMDGEETTEGTTVLQRAAAGPDGSHAASGDWELKEIGQMSDAALTFSYEIDGDTIVSTANSGGYTAVLGGEAVTPEGDETGGVVKVEKTGENTYRETYMRDGEVINVLDMTVEGDTLKGVSTDPRDDSVFRWTAMRQS